LELPAGTFSHTALWWFGALYLATLVAALRLARWRRFIDPAKLNVFLGATLAIIALWHVRAQLGSPIGSQTGFPVGSGVAFHLLGVTTLTLMFGWSFAILAAALALVALTLNGRGSWEMFAVNSLLLAVIPVTLSQVSLVVVRSRLPKNFFIFVLGNGFFTAGIAAFVTLHLAAWLLGASGAMTPAQVADRYVPFFPLLALPEAFINGWMITALVAFRPDWVYSFSDELYIRGK
jgi:uncharacterized membrane protein